MVAEKIGVDPRQLRRVAVASSIGTTIEWYDFFIFSTAVPLVFNTQFFSTLSPASGTLAGFATLGRRDHRPARRRRAVGALRGPGRAQGDARGVAGADGRGDGRGRAAAHVRPDRGARADAARRDAAPAGCLGRWRVGRGRADGRRARAAGQARGLRRRSRRSACPRVDPRAAGVHHGDRVDHPGAVHGLGLAAAVPVQHRAGGGRARGAALARGEPGVRGVAPRAGAQQPTDRRGVPGAAAASWCSPR